MMYIYASSTSAEAFVADSNGFSSEMSLMVVRLPDV